MKTRGATVLQLLGGTFVDVNLGKHKIKHCQPHKMRVLPPLPKYQPNEVCAFDLT